MNRRFIHKLESWSNDLDKKPLLVIGARQVGKTYIIEDFLDKNYDDYFEINLERQKEYLDIFEDNLDPQTIIRNMERLSGRTLSHDVPIFIDEIQQSENAITSLKYFSESKEKYTIIGAGSLLGVKIARFHGSFPVGKVHIEKLFPMDFEEFLDAIGENSLRDGIVESYNSKKVFPDSIHEKALSLYHDYIFVGGMPGAVKNYIEKDQNILSIDSDFYYDLKTSYLADMTKYTTSPAESLKINETYESVPRQLARENPKFKYKEIRKNASKRDFLAPLDWLIQSSMVYRVKKLDTIKTPLKGYESEDSIKIYLSDVGLLTNTIGMKYSDILSTEQNLYKGAIAENYVVQQLASYGKNLHYYKPSESMEIDLVLDSIDGILPIEIKSGRHKRSTSLKNYIKEFTPSYSIRISELNFGFTDGILSLPHYAVFCLKGL